MKKYIKFVMVSLLILLLVSIIYLAMVSIIIGGLFLKRPTYNRMEKIYQANQAVLQSIVTYITDTGYEEIYISNTEDGCVMFTGLESGTINVTNTEIRDDIRLLFENKKFNVIEKNKNTIYFQQWSNLDNGRGIAYSIDNSIPSLPFLTRFEPLSDENWYYYEENYNEWKTRNNERK